MKPLRCRVPIGKVLRHIDQKRAFTEFIPETTSTKKINIIIPAVSCKAVILISKSKSVHFSSHKFVTSPAKESAICVCFLF